MTLPRQTLRLTVHELADALDVNKLYGDGIRQEAPQALQVVDRFHLVKNRRQATEAFLHNQRPGRFRPRRRAPPRRSPVWPVYGVNNYHLMQQFPLMAQSPQTSAVRRAFGAVRLSISLCYRCFCRHRGSIVSWKKTWGRARGALTPRRGHLVRDWRGKCTGKRESRGIDRKDGGGTLQAVEQGFEQLTHRLQGVGVKQRAHALP